MPRKKSRTQRKGEFSKAAEAMYERMEDWYDAHPNASLEEIEDELCRQRRGLMGSTLETLIVGRDSGFDVQPPKCRQCGQPMAFEDYRAWTVKGLEGDSTLERASYPCPACGEQGFFPLWTRGCGCGVTIGAPARRAWPFVWVCKPSLSIWLPRLLGMRWGEACRRIAWRASLKIGAEEWSAAHREDFHAAGGATVDRNVAQVANLRYTSISRAGQSAGATR